MRVCFLDLAPRIKECPDIYIGHALGVIAWDLKSVEDADADLKLLGREGFYVP